MKALFREGNTLVHYSKPVRVVKTGSWDTLKAALEPGSTWAGFITYEGEACFFQPDIIEPFKKNIPFKKPALTCVKPFDTEAAYRKKIGIIQEAILDGDVYQVNLSHETIYEGEIDPLALFLKLSHNPFSAYFDDGERHIISSSPEKLLSREGGTLESCPIKGTAPIGKSQELLDSGKDSAELNMITDLVRSDMSWLGSPRLISEKTLTTYPHIHHLHSVIQAESDRHPIDCLRALFPGGSITGCPRPSAMRLIRELEERKRGIYTGSMGVIKPNGDFCFNIAIRTLTYEQSRLSWALGGGITIDSDPSSEYEETFSKGKEIEQALSLFQL